MAEVRLCLAVLVFFAGSAGLQYEGALHRLLRLHHTASTGVPLGVPSQVAAALQEMFAGLEIHRTATGALIAGLIEKNLR